MQRMKTKRTRVIFAMICMALLACQCNVFSSWRESKAYFTLGEVNGKKVFLDPDGKPFYSLAMVYAYGPESTSTRRELKAADVLAELKKMKDYGFNSVNFYGDAYLKEVLDYCEENNISFYPRTSYTGDEFPDFMDPEFRDKAKHSYDKLLDVMKNYRCILAIDMDQRWMFRDSDWGGRKHPSIPVLGKTSVSYFPKWLKNKYGKISALNKQWRKSYSSFEDVLFDAAIIDKNSFVNMGINPWRNDIVEYVHWTINDFLKDLTAYMRNLDPHHLITYTTELPEVFNFPLSNRENSGIDFVSPVHYNGDMDFGRDYASLAKLMMQCKFHYDMNKIPVYISESGWRTKTLKQNPPNTAYAIAKLGDERHMAELNLRQNTFTAALPFMTGWAYFKWYDKWFEGDFGYINDDGSDKPISKVGKVMNRALQVNMQGEKSPEAYLYYPAYALGSPKASFSQLKTAVVLLEFEFFSQFNNYCAEAVKYLDNPGQEMMKGKLFTDVAPLFNRTWYPFQFTAELKGDDKPVLLAGASLEQISEKDRKELLNKKTITFGQTGIYNERFENTEPWNLAAVDIKSKMYESEEVQFDLSQFIGGKRKNEKCLNNDANFNVYYAGEGRLNYMSCKGQLITVNTQSFAKLKFLAASSSGNVFGEVKLKYSDGSTGTASLGPTVPSWIEKPAFGHLGLAADIEGKKIFVTHVVDVPVNPMKKLVSIQLPNEPEICIFAVSAGRYGAVENCRVTVDFRGKKVSGTTPWVLFLKPEARGDFTVLATFDNGAPAIAQSKDGKHIAFLYDALTWEGSESEISGRWTENADILKQLIKELK